MYRWFNNPTRGLLLAETMASVAEDAAIRTYRLRRPMVDLLAAAAAHADAVARLDAALAALGGLAPTLTGGQDP